MSRSMTGYGRGERSLAGRNYLIEIKSVNAKFCEIKPHCPREYLQWEQEIASQVKKRFTRGRFDLFLQIEELPEAQQALRLNTKVAENYHALLNKLNSTFSIKSEITLSHLLTCKELFTPQQEDTQQAWHAVQDALQEALDKLEQVSRAEGKTLADDIRKRVKLITAHAATIEKKRPQILEQNTARLRLRIETLLKEKRLDNDRLEQEIAIIADRSEITEEIVRLRSHLKRVVELLDGDAPLGRELDFVVQEIHREINTLGQKSQEYSIADLVIQMKSETEKIREQVQNLE